MSKVTQIDFRGSNGALVPRSGQDDGMDALRLAEVLRAGQNRLLEMIAKETPLDATLDSLMRLIESQSEGVLCSVLLLDESGKHLLHGAAPSLPKAYCDAIDGVAIGPQVGSCGTAAYRRTQVIVTDIQTDPLWAEFAALAESYELRACWSTPIISFQGKLLGTFAMYYKVARTPGAVEMGLIDVATHIAGIAIERRNKEQELRRYALNLEELVRERTVELSAAKELAEASNRKLSLVNQDLSGALHNLSVAQEELVSQGKMAALGALVAGVAHELNTPIGNALTVASTLEHKAHQFQIVFDRGQLLKSTLSEFVQSSAEMASLITRSCARAASLISSFKQVAVDQSSEQRRSFDLRALVDDNVAALRPSFKHASWVIDVDVPADIQCDSYPGPLGQVIANLVQNAVIHAFEGRPNGKLNITASLHDSGVDLVFADDGKGMDAGVLSHIFEPFYTTRMGQGGSGLGLSISRNIVTGLLGGALHASSELGHGSRFVVSFPLLAPHKDASNKS